MVLPWISQEQSGSITSLTVLATLLLLQPRTSLAFWAISALRTLPLQYRTSSQAVKEEMQNKTLFHIKGELVEDHSSAKQGAKSSCSDLQENTPFADFDPKQKQAVDIRRVFDQNIKDALSAQANGEERRGEERRGEERRGEERRGEERRGEERRGEERRGEERRGEERERRGERRERRGEERRRRGEERRGEERRGEERRGEERRGQQDMWESSILSI
ncbi:hypothetical protein DUI87_10729 [Hirundo rustica rustica]|uniref:Uncharacterized protein n=1 Tax=Hirundo rustica rustica TaxID=333673 RepID=A0A3M0KJH0_HIRRU|nr:hypothetical protein DUI87_10729 [Hirundo rustica rustica]